MIVSYRYKVKFNEGNSITSTTQKNTQFLWVIANEQSNYLLHIIVFLYIVNKKL